MFVEVRRVVCLLWLVPVVVPVGVVNLNVEIFFFRGLCTQWLLVFGWRPDALLSCAVGND